MLAEHLGMNIGQVSKAYAIDNVNLRNAFEAFIENITKKHQDNPSLFKKRNWDPIIPEKLPEKKFTESQEEYERKITKIENVKRANRFIQHMNHQLTKFRNQFNDGSKVSFSSSFLFSFSFLFDLIKSKIIIRKMKITIIRFSSK